PKRKGIVKERLEFEVQVSGFKKAHEILCALGFRKALIYEKMRQKWRLGKIEICLDTLPFGKYVEIEGDVEGILGTAVKLGFKERQFVNSNYFELAKEKGVEGDILFSSD
ncbi:MAG: class IV adenylate cyclase, partial [archaeon]|nr:class IV adenylate cyclase [archaeon]